MGTGVQMSPSFFSVGTVYSVRYRRTQIVTSLICMQCVRSYTAERHHLDGVTLCKRGAQRHCQTYETARVYHLNKLVNIRICLCFRVPICSGKCNGLRFLACVRPYCGWLVAVIYTLGKRQPLTPHAYDFDISACGRIVSFSSVVQNQFSHNHFSMCGTRPNHAPCQPLFTYMMIL